MSKIRVFLVDDHYVVCEGLRRMLEQEEDLCVVGEAQTGEEALAKLRNTLADVVLFSHQSFIVRYVREVPAANTDCRLLEDVEEFGESTHPVGPKLGRPHQHLPIPTALELLEETHRSASSCWYRSRSVGPCA